MDPNDQQPHIFRRYGRSYHLALRNTGDLRHALTLDEGHWLATGAPVTALNLDPTFLGFVDIDANGRIMCFEVRTAIEWLLDVLSDHAGIDAGRSELSLETINMDSADGQSIHANALKILRQQGKKGAPAISLEDVRHVRAMVEARPVSEAGVVLPAALPDDDTRQFVRDVVTTVGGADHPGGEQGVNQDSLDAFLTQAEAHLVWLAEGEFGGDAIPTDIMPLGEKTARAASAYLALRDKLDLYYAQCEAVAFDERTLDFLRPSDEELKSTDLNDPATLGTLIAAGPLAPPSRELVLALDGDINPAYRRAVEDFRKLAVEPVLGRPVQTLSRDDWQSIKAFFAAHEAWLSRKTGEAVEGIGGEQLRAYLDPTFRETVETAISRCNRTALALDGIRRVEKLLLYQAHMLTFVNNFVSFPYLYSPDRRAAFEMGSLVIDGRRLTLSVKVDDRTEHAKMAETSDIFIIYADILNQDGQIRYTVALPVTSGGRGNVCVGKRGVFQTVDGQEFDARIVQIIENPISITETLIAPVQRLGRLLSGRIEAMTTTAEKKLDATAGAALDQAQSPPPPTATPQSRGLFAGGMLMGGGVALAALSSAIAYVSATLDKIGPYKIAGGVLLAILAVIAPASILALIKLRRRDLSAILEGSGWAINARMRLTFRLGRVFTFTPPYPDGSRGVPKRWQVYLLWGLIAALIVAIGRLVQALA